MPWEELNRENIIKNFNSEMYKNLIIRYLQTRGYDLSKRFIQEDFNPDMILEKNNEIVWIDAKNTKVSIFAKGDKFNKELLDYFINWLKLKDKYHISLYIFAVNLAKKEESKEILTDSAIPSKILDWFKELKSHESNSSNIKLLNSISENNIIEFFKSISVIICSPYDLLLEIKKKESSLINATLDNYKKKLREIENRKLPIFEKDNIIINFLELEHPDYYWEVQSRFKSAMSIYKKLNPNNDENIRIPAFTIAQYKNEEPSLRSFEKNLDVLRPYVIGPIIKKEINVLSNNWKVELIKASLKRYLWCKGLRRDNDDYYFIYQKPFNRDLDNNISPIIIKALNNEKIVATPRYIDDNRLNFIEHKSINIKLGCVENNLGLFIWPGFIFTYDGINTMEKEATRRIYRKYLNPNWNRNLNNRSLLKFWEFFLTNNEFQRKKDSWFENFKILKLQKLTIEWKSETVEKNAIRLDSFLTKGDS